MSAGVIVRVISTLIGAIVPLVAVSGFLSPTDSSPIGSISSFIPFQSIVSENAALSPYAQYLPFLAGGGGALAVWMIASQAIGGIGSMAAGSMSGINRSRGAGMSSMDDIQKRMKAAMDTAGLGTAPEKQLPSDMNKVQYRILTSFYQGVSKSKDVGSQLSMARLRLKRKSQCFSLTVTSQKRTN